MTRQIPIAIVGVGKIARDQHVPALRGSLRYQLVATVSHDGSVDGVPAFRTMREMIGRCPDVRAVSICTPPIGRLDLVRDALDLGLDVMIEKPPAATLGEAQAIVEAARRAKRALFVAWHSQHAPALEMARQWVEAGPIKHVQVTWKEDARVWHPGQEWIWQAGVGVFDPGINALSVLTKLFPGHLLIKRSTLMFPGNRDAPVAASLRLEGPGSLPIDADFDFDQRGPPTWEIAFEAEQGRMRLIDGGVRISINNVEHPTSGRPEYPSLYRRFADLVVGGESETDLAPLRLVADAFMAARRDTVCAFDW